MAVSVGSRLLPGLSHRARAGAVFVIVVALLLIGLAFKNQIRMAFMGGETVTAEFDGNYGLRAGLSKVKVAGLKVGLVTDVEYEGDKAIVTMKVDEDAVQALGSEPSAKVTPLTLLGGQYSVELLPGGDGEYDGDVISLDRTSTPVELDQVLAALPRDTRKATQGVVGNLSETLEHGGRRGLEDVLDAGPQVLPDAGTALEAAQGNRPGRDLADVVTGFQGFAETLAERRVQLTPILEDLSTTSAVLGSHRDELATTVDRLPETLDAADDGLDQLDGTLTNLDRSTEKLMPTVRELEPLLNTLGPTLKDARPVVADLPPLLRDARATVSRLVPLVDNAQVVVDHVRGPVIERVDGPILDKLGKTWHGAPDGPYKHSGGGVQAENKFYQEIAYMITNLDRSSMTQDPQGSLLNFQAGVGTSTLQPIGLDEALANLLPQLRGDY
ncbi:MlaD family protein [Nocardioides sp. SYSU DS0651]|uniref:MlaD family protein n=1 Tax=Nocardioides sp. SYSU DS0651 TaxID=3415955 RepID=UPI003F4C4939